MMSSRDVIDLNEIQTYASLEKMLHKAIHAVRQLKKKGNTYTSSAPKQTIKAVKPTSKVLSTRCFKCHRVGHYANKCRKQKLLVTLENAETEPEKEVSLSIQKSDQNQNLRTDLFEEEGNDTPRFEDQSIGANQCGDQDVQLISTKVRSSDRTDQTDRAVPRTSRLKLRQEKRPDDRIP
uniref:CCHC-type domain-containing protein n=1 Tax=Brassica oleracea var. oleracea TaxID=109376 RepID=A0A0D3CFD3_BRAOL